MRAFTPRRNKFTGTQLHSQFFACKFSPNDKNRGWNDLEFR